MFLSNLVQEGYVEGMNGPTLFEGMYADDTEGKKMKEMPGVDELVMTYPCSSLQCVNLCICIYIIFEELLLN